MTNKESWFDGYRIGKHWYQPEAFMLGFTLGIILMIAVEVYHG